MSQTSAPASFSELTQSTRDCVNAALAGYSEFAEGCPPRLREAIRYSLLAPGKRLRPLLAVLAAEACGGSLEAAMPAACAVEMVHTYSLIHDDLPAMDDDDLRRGRPTNHKVFGEGLAVLAGDALLTRAFEIVASGTRPAEVAAACCAALAAAAGANGMVGGQVDDLAAEGRIAQATDRGADAPRSPEWVVESPVAALESIHARKTGAMLNVSLRLGALTAGASAVQLSALEHYGTRLGLAFQITDDLLDVDGHQEAVGKRVGKDSGRGKLTYPGLLGVEESRRRAARLIAEGCEALAPFGAKAEGLEALARYVLERDH